MPRAPLQWLEEGCDPIWNLPASVKTSPVLLISR